MHGRLQSLGLQKVGHSWAPNHIAHTLSYINLFDFSKCRHWSPTSRMRGDNLSYKDIVMSQAYAIQKTKPQFYFVHFWLHYVAGMQNLCNRGSNLCSLPWKLRVLTTGPPGKPLNRNFKPHNSWQHFFSHENKCIVISVTFEWGSEIPSLLIAVKDF